MSVRSIQNTVTSGEYSLANEVKKPLHEDGGRQGRGWVRNKGQ